MEAKLTEFVKRVNVAIGDSLKAVVLYGSAASGEFREGHSDLNILCLVKRAGLTEFEHLHATAEWWMRQGNRAPLIFTIEDLHRSADIFAIELMDMKLHHRVLFGEDFLTNLDVPMRLHRLQVERELRTNWIRLRQAILIAPAEPKARLAIMTQSLSPFCTLFRHALVALEQPMPATKVETVRAVAALTGADPVAFYKLLEMRSGKPKATDADVESLLKGYLEFVELVTDEVDRRLDVLGA